MAKARFSIWLAEHLLEKKVVVTARAKIDVAETLINIR